MIRYRNAEFRAAHEARVCHECHGPATEDGACIAGEGQCSRYRLPPDPDDGPGWDHIDMPMIQLAQLQREIRWMLADRTGQRDVAWLDSQPVF